MTIEAAKQSTEAEKLKLQESVLNASKSAENLLNQEVLKDEMEIVESLIFNNVSVGGEKLLDKTDAALFDKTENKRTEAANGIKWKVEKKVDKNKKEIDKEYILTFGYPLKDKDNVALLDKKTVIKIDFTVEDGIDYKKIILTPTEEQKEVKATDKNGNDRYFDIVEPGKTDGADIQIKENEEKTLEGIHTKINAYKLKNSAAFEKLDRKTTFKDLDFLKDIKLSDEILQQDNSSLDKGFIKKLFIEQDDRYYSLGEVKFDIKTTPEGSKAKINFLYEDIEIPVKVNNGALEISTDAALETKLTVLVKKIETQKSTITDYMNNTSVANKDNFPVLFQKTENFKTELKSDKIYKGISLDGIYKYDLGNTNIINFSFTEAGDIQLRDNLGKDSQDIYYKTKKEEYYQLKINKTNQRLDFTQLKIKNFPYMDELPKLGDGTPAQIKNGLFYYNDAKNKAGEDDLIKIENGSYFDDKGVLATELPVTKDTEKKERKLSNKFSTTLEASDYFDESKFTAEDLAAQGMLPSEIEAIFAALFVKEVGKKAELKNGIKVKKADSDKYEYYQIDQAKDGTINFQKETEIAAQAKEIMEKIKNDLKLFKKLDESISLWDVDRSKTLELTGGIRLHPILKEDKLAFLQSDENKRDLNKNLVYNIQTNEKTTGTFAEIALLFTIDKNYGVDMKPIRKDVIGEQTYKKIYYEDSTSKGKLNLDTQLDRVNLKKKTTVTQ